MRNKRQGEEGGGGDRQGKIKRQVKDEIDEG